MLATMGPDIVFARLPVILTCGIVTALLGFILIKIEFHSRPLSVGSHATKGIGYPMRVLISIVPSYTTQDGEFVTKVDRGTLAVISGHIAHSAPDAMKVKTRTTILGVRGTHFLVQVEE